MLGSPAEAVFQGRRLRCRFGASLAGTGAPAPRDSAMRVVADLQRRRAAGEYVPSVFLAAAYAGVGDLTRGFAWLNRALDEHDIYIPENFMEPLLDPLRDDPRFAAVLRRMGLAPGGRS